MAWHEAVGGVGVAIILSLYFLSQSGRLAIDRPASTLGNAVGACAILFSLWVDFNLPAVLVEVAWVLISLYGFVRFWLRRRSAGGH